MSYISSMKRLVLTLGLVLATALPAATGEIPLATLSDWLARLSTASGVFTQINPDGTISTGRIFISRPGRMRFEYDPPDPALVMAGGGTLAIFDPKSNQPPQQFPLKQTPLWVILDQNVDLTRADMITAHVSDDVSTTVTAQDPENPDIGHIDLVFTDAPVELRQWKITDEFGAETTVILGDMVFGENIAAGLFSVQLEVQKRRPQR